MKYTQTLRGEAMTKNEINNMFSRCDNSQLKAIMSVLLMTGGRISEVLMIKGKDISSDDEHIYFNCYILKKRNGIERMQKKIKKTHEYYVYFKDWINQNNFKEENFIFSYSRKYVWKIIKIIGPESTPHLFRHTVATYLGKHMDVFTLQKWMNWSKLEMASRYVHPTNVINAGTDALEKAF